MPPLIQSEACVSWVHFETPADAAADSDAVVIGRVIDRTGSASVFGASADVWSVDVDEWVEGDGPERIEVISTPVTCEGSRTSPDPLEEARGDRVAVFLTDDPAGWRTVTPLQGVVSVTPDGALPGDWPSGP